MGGVPVLTSTTIMTTATLTSVCNKAVKENNLAVLSFILDDFTCPNPGSLIAMALRRGYTEMLTYLLDRYPRADCSLALTSAAKYNNISVLDRLLPHCDSRSIHTAIYLAQKYDHTEVRDLVLAHVAKVDMKDPPPPVVMDEIIRTSALYGYQTPFYTMSRQISNVNGMLGFLAAHDMKEMFDHLLVTRTVKNPEHLLLELKASNPYYRVSLRFRYNL